MFGDVCHRFFGNHINTDQHCSAAFFTSLTDALFFFSLSPVLLPLLLPSFPGKRSSSSLETPAGSPSLQTSTFPSHTYTLLCPVHSISPCPNRPPRPFPPQTTSGPPLKLPSRTHPFSPVSSHVRGKNGRSDPPPPYPFPVPLGIDWSYSPWTPPETVLHNPTRLSPAETALSRCFCSPGPPTYSLACTFFHPPRPTQPSPLPTARLTCFYLFFFLPWWVRVGGSNPYTFRR